VVCSGFFAACMFVPRYGFTYTFRFGNTYLCSNAIDLCRLKPMVLCYYLTVRRDSDLFVAHV
jgi:hypothetical protein